MLMTSGSHGLCQRPACVCATDGSSKESAAAWPVSGQGGEVLAAGLSSEDQSSYVAELCGLATVLEAAVLALRDVAFTRLVVLCDCKAALQVVSPSHKGEGMVFSRRIVAALDALRLRILVDLVCPAYGREAATDWQLPARVSEALARRPDQEADSIATDRPCQ
ncbi:unnamed protein product, partial [Symbiodinium necroappetens]